MKKLYRIAMLTCMILAVAIMPVMAECVTSGSLTTEIVVRGAKYCFGSYPQTEIVGEATQSGVYGKSWESDGAYEIDEGLYSNLQSADWNSDDDATVNGVKYHRIKKGNATYTSANSNYYSWSDSTTYHYFRYDPIKWRVLKVGDEDAFLLADVALDDQKYNNSYTSITWEKSTVRNWLNSTFYNRAFTTEEQEAITTTIVENKDNLLYGTAGGNNTEDKIFLLSESEVYGEGGVVNGFASSYSTYDKARMSKSSSYAKAIGVYSNSESSYSGNCVWWLRSPGHYSLYAAYVNNSGSVYSNGNNVDTYNYAIRPALRINLKSPNLPEQEMVANEMILSQEEYDYDGTAKEPTVTIEGLTEGEDYHVAYKNNTEVGIATAYAIGQGNWAGTLSRTFKIGNDLSNHTIHLIKNSYIYDGEAKEPVVSIDGLTEGQDFEVEYSNNINAGTAEVTVKGVGVCFGTLTKTFKIEKKDVSDTSYGSYPQTEIVGEDSQSGVYGKSWEADGDYVVDEALYNNLQSADWNSDDDATVDGAKYHRIKKSNATYTSTDSRHYSWSDNTTYHYYRYDPIKWRVLQVDGEDAFLLADTALDDQRYNNTNTSITWENSTVRSWLNSTFYNRAFNSAEQEAIKTTTVKNKDNLNSGTAGGNDTEDKVFLLSESEVYDEGGVANGFAESYDTDDKARMSKSSSYAKAMGAYSNTDSSYLGNCYWWLRSPGDNTYNAAYVDSNGAVGRGGYDVNSSGNAIRPALHINLKSSNLITKHEVFEDIQLSSTEYDYDGNAKEPKVIIEGFKKGVDYTVTYSDNINAGRGKVIIEGKGNYTGKFYEYFTINKANIQNYEVVLAQKEIVYDGTAKEPIVAIKNLTDEESYDVSYENNTEPGTAKVIITGKGNCFGTKEVTFRIGRESKNVSVELEDDRFEFENTDIKPAVIVKDGERTLTEGEDYELGYSNNKMPGEASVKVIFGGEYLEDERELKYTIECTDQVVVDKKEATCTEGGYTGYIICKKYNVVITPGKFIPATGHNMEHKKTAPKVGIKGSEWDECTTCGAKLNVKPIAALNPAATKITSIKAVTKSFTVKWIKRSYTGYQIRYSLKSSMASSKTVTITKSSTVSKKISKLKAKKKYYVQVRTYKTVRGKKYYSAWTAKKAVTTK